MAQFFVPQVGSSDQIVHDLSEGIVSIGRHVSNTIVLNQESVSSYHAQINRKDSTCTLKDLGSSNGTMINWEVITERDLVSGDTVHFGIVECRYVDSNAGISLENSDQAVSPKAIHAGITKVAGSLLSNIRYVVGSELKRLSLKILVRAKIEKIRRLDLTKSYSELGKKTYEAKVDDESYEQTYAEIELLEEEVRIKEEVVPTSEELTFFVKIKQTASRTKNVIQAEYLKSKIEQLFIKLGKAAADKSPTEFTSRAYSNVQTVRSVVISLDERLFALQPNPTALIELRQTSNLFLRGLCAISRTAYSKGLIAFVARTKTVRQKVALYKKPILVALALLLCIAIIVGVVHSIPLAWTTKGQVALGDMYAEGKNVPKDMSKALEWYSKAANSGNSDAQVKLASLYLLGWLGSKPDDVKAIFWYRKAAEQNNALGQHYLGYMYRQGRGTSKDDREAFRWCEKSAKQGYTASQCLLGLMYFDGAGVGRDYDQSAKWFKLAASRGDTTAEIMLGGQYLKGVGVKQSATEGIAWMEKAAAAGDNNAIAQLGVLYKSGSYVKQDKVKAAALLVKAANAGNGQAQIELDQMRKEDGYSRTPNSVDVATPSRYSRPSPTPPWYNYRCPVCGRVEGTQNRQAYKTCPWHQGTVYMTFLGQQPD